MRLTHFVLMGYFLFLPLARAESGGGHAGPPLPNRPPARGLGSERNFAREMDLEGLATGAVALMDLPELLEASDLGSISDATLLSLPLLPVISASHLGEMWEANRDLQAALTYLSQATSFCAEIQESAQTLRAHGHAVYRRYLDLSTCCNFEVSHCSSECAVPPSSRIGSTFRGFVSNLPLMPLFMGSHSAQAILTHTADQCGQCVNRALGFVERARIEGNQVTHCGGWMP